MIDHRITEAGGSFSMAKRRRAGGGRKAAATTVRAYLAALPDERARRLRQIRDLFLGAVDGVRESMRYRMPTYERDGRWVALANNKSYVSVYFCSQALIEPLRVRHPELDCGRGCVRVRDSQHVPLYELRAAFVSAMGEAHDGSRSGSDVP